MLLALPTKIIRKIEFLKIVSFLLTIFISDLAFANPTFGVTPNAETPPVVTGDDAADDPAIWVNRANPALSLIFGTDKKSGIYVYDLSLIHI